MSHSKTGNKALELADARQSFSLWQSKADESEDEYTLRKRKNELYALVRRVIKNELDETQQEFVRLYWYEGKTLREISEIMKLDKSTLSRKEKKINDIIYEKLKYAVEYRYGRDFSEKTRLIIKSRSPACCPCDGKSIGERLRSLRIRQSLTEKDISKISGINEERIRTIEAKGAEITADELKRICELYGTSSDYIIFGRSKEGTDL